MVHDEDLRTVPNVAVNQDSPMFAMKNFLAADYPPRANDRRRKGEKGVILTGSPTVNNIILWKDRGTRGYTAFSHEQRQALQYVPAIVDDDQVPRFMSIRGTSGVPVIFEIRALMEPMTLYDPARLVSDDENEDLFFKQCYDEDPPGSIDVENVSSQLSPRVLELWDGSKSKEMGHLGVVWVVQDADSELKHVSKAFSHVWLTRQAVCKVDEWNQQQQMEGRDRPIAISILDVNNEMEYMGLSDEFVPSNAAASVRREKMSTSYSMALAVFGTRFPAKHQNIIAHQIGSTKDISRELKKGKTPPSDNLQYYHAGMLEYPPTMSELSAKVGLHVARGVI